MESMGRSQSPGRQSGAEASADRKDAVVVKKERRSLQGDSNNEHTIECNLTTAVSKLFGWEPHQQVHVTVLREPGDGSEWVEIEAIDP